MPTENIPQSINIWDKAQHAAAYGVFMLLGFWLTSKTKPRLLLATFIIAFGLTLEYLQGLTGYRDASWLDAIANSIGVISAYLLVLFDKKLRHKKTCKKQVFQ